MMEEELLEFPPMYQLQQDKAFRVRYMKFWKCQLISYAKSQSIYRVNLEQFYKNQGFKCEPSAELLTAAANELVKEYLAFYSEKATYLVFAENPFEVMKSVLAYEPSSLYEIRCKLENTVFKGLPDEKTYFDQMLAYGEQLYQWKLIRIKGELRGVQLL